MYAVCILGSIDNSQEALELLHVVIREYDIGERKLALELGNYMSVVAAKFSE